MGDSYTFTTILNIIKYQIKAQRPPIMIINNCSWMLMIYGGLKGKLA